MRIELSDSLKTDLVPNAGNTTEVIEHITSMIKANISHSRRLPSVAELLCLELVVEPLAPKSLQLSTLSNTNSRANRKLLLIRLHRECTLGQCTIDSIIERASSARCQSPWNCIRVILLLNTRSTLVRRAACSAGSDHPRSRLIAPASCRDTGSRAATARRRRALT